jgi:hypothetical protein
MTPRNNSSLKQRAVMIFSCSLSLIFVTRARGEAPELWSTDGQNIFTANHGGVGIGTRSPTNKLEVDGDLGITGDLNFPGRGFHIGGGGALEWPGRVRFGAGGDGPGLPPQRGKMRAQPGSNMEILPLKDYARSALDIYPTKGAKPEFDALAELTIHRIMPSNSGHEMLSISALASVQDKYGVIVEAHGAGRLKPLDFMVVRGGLLENDQQQPFWAQVMRMKTDGTIQFGPLRTGPRNQPVDIINIEQDDGPRNVGSSQEGDESEWWRQYNGPSDSHFIRYTAKQFQNGRAAHRADWRTNVHIDEGGQSSFVVQSRTDDAPYEKQIAIRDDGTIDLPAQESAVILTSPNGKRWRITVDDNGQLHTTPAR